jgi:hypothetical protein
MNAHHTGVQIEAFSSDVWTFWPSVSLAVRPAMGVLRGRMDHRDRPLAARTLHQIWNATNANRTSTQMGLSMPPPHSPLLGDADHDAHDGQQDLARHAEDERHEADEPKGDEGFFH